MTKTVLAREIEQTRARADEALKQVESQKLGAYDDLRSFGITWSHIQIRRLQKQGAFPKSVKLGPAQNSRIAWRTQDILDWIDSRK
jgi:hypothetical protein